MPAPGRFWYNPWCGVYDFPATVPNRGEGSGNGHLGAVFLESERFERGHSFPARDPAEDVGFLIDAVWRNEHEHGLVNRFPGRIAEDFFSSWIPTGDNSVQGLAQWDVSVPT